MYKSIGEEAPCLIAAAGIEHQRGVGWTRPAACGGELHVHRVDYERYNLWKKREGEDE